MAESALNTNFFELLNQTGSTSFVDLVDKLTRRSQFNASSYDWLFDNPMIFKQFTSLESAFDDIESLRKKQNPTTADIEALSAFNDISKSGDFKDFLSGLNKTNASLEAAKEVAQSLISNITEIINLGGSYKKDRLKVTDDSRGIFDFSLASQGLFRPIEFYSEDYKKYIEGNNEDEFAHLELAKGVVPDERVRKDVSKSGVIVYYFIGEGGKKFACERRQKGATAVFSAFPDKCMLKTNEQGIQVTYLISNPKKVFNGEGKTRLKYASSTKKAYLMFERKPDATKYVDIFIPVNFLNVTDGNRMMNALAPILAAITLEQFGIQTRISAMRLGQVDGRIFETISIPVKDYDQSTIEEFDQIMNLLGKERYAGSFFAAHLINQANKGEQLDKNGNPIISGHLARGLNPYYYEADSNINLFMRYKNWVKENEGKPYVDSKVVNPNFQIFTHQAVDNVFYDRRLELNPKTLAENLPYVMYQFYRYMDFLSIEFNDMADYVGMLMTRWEEDKVFRKLFVPPQNREELKDTIRKYILNILVYKYYSSTKGEYADTPEEAKEKEERKFELITQMDETLKNY